MAAQWVSNFSMTFGNTISFRTCGTESSYQTKEAIWNLITWRTVRSVINARHAIGDQMSEKTAWSVGNAIMTKHSKSKKLMSSTTLIVENVQTVTRRHSSIVTIVHLVSTVHSLWAIRNHQDSKDIRWWWVEKVSYCMEDCLGMKSIWQSLMWPTWRNKHSWTLVNKT